MKRKKKLNRRLLGVGHPFFTRSNIYGVTTAPWPDALVLLDAEFGKCTKTKSLSRGGIGARQKVRIYMEWEA